MCECLCDCGTIKEYRLSAVVSGNSTSCNCLRSLNTVKDLPFSKAIMSSWDNIIGRCHRPRNTSYEWYGEKGIIMCDEWRYNFREFYKWSMSHGWREGYVLDKDELCEKLCIEPKIYAPNTCQWVTREYNLRKEWECNTI